MAQVKSKPTTKQQLADLETPLNEACNLARALRMLASSDEIGGEPGAALDTVADALYEKLITLREMRNRISKQAVTS
jgi:hypothetical protein